MYRSPAKYHTVPHHLVGTPLQQTPKTKSIVPSSKMSALSEIRTKNQGALMNSTVQHAWKSTPGIPCELSTINMTRYQEASVLAPQPVTDTPAKVFARLKAKVQQRNLEEHGEDPQHFTHRHMGKRDSCPKVQQLHFDSSLQEGQETCVLTRSSPKSPKTIFQVGDLPPTSNPTVINDGGRASKCDANSFYEPVVLLERMHTEDMIATMKARQKVWQVNPVSNSNDIITGVCVFGDVSRTDDSEGGANQSCGTDVSLGMAALSQMVQRRQEKADSNPREDIEPPCQVLHVFEDSLLQLSPRIAIPQKEMPQFKQQTKEMKGAQNGRTNLNEIHLRDWILKLHIRDLVVDGIRLDDNVPWHSSCITERISSNRVKTASGKTYVLVGKMSRYHNSSFPSWFLKKFIFGFPKLWKKDLNKFLADSGRSENNRVRNNSALCQQQEKRTTRQQISKHLNDTVISSASVLPENTSVSRSGRIIRPPLEYWRGGRITVDSDMNVTVHEDYKSTSILIRPRAEPVVIIKSQNLPKDQPGVSRGMQIVSDDEMLAPRRTVKQCKPSKRRLQGTEVSDTDSQNKSQSTASSSDSDHAARQPHTKWAQSERMCLRRGWSYSTKRTSTGSESEATTFDPGTGVPDTTLCAEKNGSALQGRLSERRTRRNQKPLQKVIQNECHPAPCSDSDTRCPLTRSRVQNSTDSNGVFTPPEPPKRLRRRGSMHPKREPVPLEIATSETEDSDYRYKREKAQYLVRKSCRQRTHSVGSAKNGTTNTTHSDYSNEINPFPETVDSGLHIKKDKKRHLDKPTCRKRKEPQKNKNYIDHVENFHSEPARGEKGKMAKSLLTRQKKGSGASERVTNDPDHTGQEIEVDDLPYSVPENPGKKRKATVKGKPSNRQTEKSSESEQDIQNGTWTDEELQKLNEAMNSFPKHRNGYWLNVALVVGTRSAEECQQQYSARYQSHARSRGKLNQKPAKPDEPRKETVQITAKVGTLKRKKQMWEFLDHMAKDDHDDVFTASPMRNKQIKLPAWSTNGNEPDFSQLQNPQTPTSNIISSVKTPQCLHITPGMLGSINRNNNDKYIYQLQKVKKRGKYGRKASPKEKFTPVPLVKKTKKRCVAEDDDFVVWNMLSDKDVPLTRSDDDEDDDDYFMEEY